MRSDNGTNFVGANNELNHCIKQLDQIKLQKFSSHQNLEWIFNSPASPWMGGVWESVLCEVESVLNGRPLTSISDDISDFEPLTPNQ